MKKMTLKRLAQNVSSAWATWETLLFCHVDIYAFVETVVGWRIFVYNELYQGFQ